MPTQEERLTTLEQRTAAYIKETSENLAMTIGLVQVQAFDIKKFSQHLDEMQESLQETLKIHLDANLAHFELLQKHADQTDKRLNSIEAQLSEHTTRFNHVDTLLSQILARLPENPS